MSIKTKLKINLYFFIIMASFMVFDWYQNDVKNFVESLIPVITVP